MLSPFNINPRISLDHKGLIQRAQKFNTTEVGLNYIYITYTHQPKIGQDHYISVTALQIKQNRADFKLKKEMYIPLRICFKIMVLARECHNSKII